MINWILISSFLILVGLIFLAITKKEEFIPKAITYTYIKCNKCAYRLKRPFQRGDFMLKEIGNCQDRSDGMICHGKLVVEGIYLEKPKTKKEIEYKKLVEKWR